MKLQSKEIICLYTIVRIMSLLYQKNKQNIIRWCGNSRITEHQRLTTFVFDPRDKPSDGYTKAYELRLTAYDLRITDYGLRLWEPYSQR